MEVSDSDIERTMHFLRQGFPNPVSKNKHTQLGVHFEEIAEMIRELSSTDQVISNNLAVGYTVMVNLADALKKSDNNISIRNEIDFLDSLCDQLVTAVGVGYVNNYDIVSAFGEVNRSNLSKFADDGSPIYDENKKLIKGPNYFKAHLSPFV